MPAMSSCNVRSANPGVSASERATYERQSSCNGSRSKNGRIPFNSRTLTPLKRCPQVRPRAQTYLSNNSDFPSAMCALFRSAPVRANNSGCHLSPPISSDSAPCLPSGRAGASNNVGGTDSSDQNRTIGCNEDIGAGVVWISCGPIPASDRPVMQSPQSLNHDEIFLALTTAKALS